MQDHDTIAAISTAVSQSGIGIIRISGDKAVRIADCVYRSVGKKKKLADAATHTIHYGYIDDPETKETLDEVLVSVMRAPRSFTAEDTVEINCHGGILAMKRVLEAVIKAGARPAQPGEFTKRAFLNGRIDLSQAEAVMDVISADNDYALRSALSQLKGNVREKTEDIRSQILYDTAKIESALDDPEHYTLDGFSTELAVHLQIWREEIGKLIASADDGRKITEGISTVILGRPNAGKSSLMNRLLGEERAIVTQVPGTTRDILREKMHLGDLTLNLIDTAGIREAEDLVEKIGVDRAIEQAEQADLILYVVDSASQMGADDDLILQKISAKKTVILLNKSDLPGRISMQDIQQHCMQAGMREIPAMIQVSMTEGTGIEELEEQIREMFYHGEISFNDQIVITNVRHKELLEKACVSMLQVEKSIQSKMPEDFYTIDLMDAYDALGQITGQSVSDDLAEEIFARFCMGK